MHRPFTLLVALVLALSVLCMTDARMTRTLSPSGTLSHTKATSKPSHTHGGIKFSQSRHKIPHHQSITPSRLTHANASTIIPDLGPYRYMGCYAKFNDLTTWTTSNDTNALEQTTIGTCYSYCGFNPMHLYFALLEGNRCYCGDQLPVASLTEVPLSTCQTPCVGDDRYACGGTNAVLLYTRHYGPEHAISPKWAAPQGYQYLGCYKTTPYSLALTFNWLPAQPNMTIAWCQVLCAGWWQPFFGVTNGTKCNCGTEVSYGTEGGLDLFGNCDIPCPGDDRYTCGGESYYNIYSQNDTLPLIPSVNGYADIGCYVLPVLSDNTTVLIDENLSLDSCMRHCYETNAARFGVMRGTYCRCIYGSQPWLTAPRAECNIPCPSGGGLCGGDWTERIYLERGKENPHTSIVTPPGWKYMGCFEDDMPPLPPAPGDMEAGYCAYLATKRNSTAQSFGLRNGKECWTENVPLSLGNKLDDDACNVKCTHDTLQWCGGVNAIQLYRKADPADIPPPPTLPGLNEISWFIKDAFNDCTNLTLCGTCQLQYDDWLHPAWNVVQSTFIALARATGTTCLPTTPAMTATITSDVPTTGIQPCYWITQTTVLYTQSMSNRPYFEPSFSYPGNAATPCCGSCTLVADGATVLYIGKDDPRRTVYAEDIDMTFTSGSLYLALRTLNAHDLCSSYGDPVGFTVVPVAASQLNTIAEPYLPCSTYSTFTIEPWNQADAEMKAGKCANISWDSLPHNDFNYYYRRNQTMIPSTTTTCNLFEHYYDWWYQYCHPQILVPEELYSLNTRWSTCIRAKNGMAFDPHTPIPTRTRPPSWTHGGKGQRDVVRLGGRNDVDVDTRGGSRVPADNPVVFTTEALPKQTGDIF